MPEGRPVNRLQGQVEHVHLYGPEVRLSVRAGGALEVILPRSVFGRLGVQVGQPVQLILDPEFLHVLPAEPNHPHPALGLPEGQKAAWP